MDTFKQLILIIGAICFIVVIGGAVYEHLTMVPVWTSAVPASLAMMQGEYAIRPSQFWIPIHPITILFLIAGLLLNLRSQARNFVFITLAGYIAVLLVTFAYFVPELMALTQTAYSATVDDGLTRRAANWETLSLVRLAFLFLLAIVLLFGLTKVSRSRSGTA